MVTLLSAYETSRGNGDMATISIASDKGGPGETTTAILVGAELALDGYTVAIIDTDLNQQAAAFVTKAQIPGLSVYADVREENVLPTIKKAEAMCDIVIIDLPGGSSTLAIKALCCSHLVLVPSQPNLPDVKAAMKTIGQVNDAEAMAKVSIARALVWTRFKPGFESRSARYVRETMEREEGLLILKCALLERAAFSEIHITGKVPRQTEPSGGAAANVTSLTGEILAQLAMLKAAA
jgi:chromosome partitioning protein